MLRRLLVLLLYPLFQSCVMGFSNAHNHVPVMFSKVYMPAANDGTIYSGNSSRLSASIRTFLAGRSDVELTSLDEARMALQVKILDRQQSITAVDSCNNPGTSYVGSLAYNCMNIHPDVTPGGSSTAPVSINQPSVSPSSESLYLVVDVRAIDLNNGKVLWSKRYFSNAVSFNEIGDPGDNRTMNAMVNTPQLHGLRYLEAIDNAVQTYSDTIAADLTSTLFASLPQE